VAAGLYLVQVKISPTGPSYPYYVSAGSSSAGGASSPPAYSVQFASPTAGQFASDATIFINPTQHILETPELFVPGTGTGLIGMAGQTSGQTFYQTVNDATAAWTFTWPTTAPTVSGTNCITAPAPLSGTVAVAAWQSCILSGQFLPLAGGTLTGPLTGTSATFSAVNTQVNAALDPTIGDIGAKITHAALACNFQCTVYVPAGTYNFATTITIPLETFGTYGLTLDPGAVLIYSGAGDAIVSPVGSSAITGSNHLLIQGGQISGTSAGVNGIHIYPGNEITIRDMLIKNFSTGSGILLEGPNGVNIYGNEIAGNKIGVLLISTFCNSANPPTCSQTTVGGANSPNNNRIDHNMITFNSQWGIFDDAVLPAASGSLGNSFAYNDLEINGSAGANYGALQIFKSVADQIGPGNYFEGSPREIVLGQYTGGGGGDYFAASGANVFGNFFTTSPPIAGRSQAFNIELENTTNTNIEGNAEQGAPFISSATNCFINAAPGGEMRTIIGRNGFFGNTTNGAGNPICVNGVGANTLAGVGSFWLMNPNYQSYMAYQNFQVNPAVTSENIAVQYLTANGSCFLQPVASSATAANNGRASLLAGTSYLSSLGAGVVAITHPSGSAMFFDVLCVNSPTGSYGTP
jgi:hypothetical protein